MYKKIVPDSPRKGNAKILKMPTREQSRAEKRLAALEELAKSFTLAGDCLLRVIADMRRELAEKKVSD